MKHLHTLFLFVLLAVSAQAQTLEVVSFDPLPLDLDASTNFPKTDPQTGRLYAIIKVVAPGDGYNFDIGQLQLGPAVPHPEQNEIWVYVPEGTRKLKISHPQYGQLKSDSKDGYCWFPSVEKAKCYRLVLSVSGIEHKMGWLTFRCNANGAEVMLGQEKIAVGKIANGALQVPCTQGMRTFTIHKSRYADTIGTVWVGDSTEVKVHLTPLFGRLAINASRMDSIYLDNRLLGISHCTIEPDNGEYLLRVKQWGYYDSVMTVRVDADTQYFSFDLRRVYGSIYVQSVPDGATVYVDGQRRGVTPCEVRGLAMDRHALRIERSNFAPIERTVGIASSAEVELPIFRMVECMPPTVSTNEVRRIGTTFAVCGGNVTSNGGGAVKERGICWSEHTNPTISDKHVACGRGTGRFRHRLRHLTPYSVCCVRAYATNKAGTSYGEEEVFRTAFKPPRTTKTTLSNSNSTFIIGQFGYQIAPQFSAGVTAGHVFKKHGFFISVMSGFSYKGVRSKNTYYTGRGHLPFFTGKVSRERFSLTAGYVVKVHKAVEVTIGIGYGFRNLYWEDSNGDWRKVVSNYYGTSRQGVDLSVGVQFNIKGYIISTDIVTTNFATLEHRIGFGVGLGKKKIR